MDKEKERMQSRGGGDAAENVDPAKRIRRPNVRLNQPYYENPRHRKLQQRWNAFKKDLEVAKKVRNRKNEDEIDSDDDVAIVNWKRDKGFNSKSKRKRVRPSSSSKKLGDSENQENEEFHLSNSGESGKEVEEEKENLGVVDGANKNSKPEKSDPSSSCRLIPDDKLSGDDDGDNNVGDNNKAIRQTGQNSEMRIDRDGNGVEVWLNQLGLGKYAPLFEVHEVDDNVLPFLTLEDLKDMGISAVGSRRKMFLSIQNLGKGFT